MTKKTMLILALLFGLTATILRASDLEYFQIAVRTSFVSPTLQNTTSENLCGFWDLATNDANKAWVWSGWMTNFCKIDKTNEAWQVYRVTVRQCQKDKLYAFTAADRGSLIHKIQYNPNIYAGFTHDPSGQLAEWGVTNIAAPAAE